MDKTVNEKQKKKSMHSENENEDIDEQLHLENYKTDL